jgi:hypothetical protein
MLLANSLQMIATLLLLLPYGKITRPLQIQIPAGCLKRSAAVGVTRKSKSKRMCRLAYRLIGDLRLPTYMHCLELTVHVRAHKCEFAFLSACDDNSLWIRSMAKAEI